ncbi:unnamed protein product [Schistocephalus solidus]|uniref:Large ribosomal subunit protein P2 n=1 Tax=Schistocephalus solidus TaxID=70667 RepID=A0A183TEY4_SCHSO|nr:unnamed protein product [Schistocephalus solidus]
MRYVAAYMLANLGGNHHIGADDIKAILDSVGIECEEERLLAQLKGKNAHDLINAGKAKLSSVSVAAPAAHAAGGAAAPSAPAAGKEEAGGKKEKAEEKKPESDEESDDDMGFGLFD